MPLYDYRCPEGHVDTYRHAVDSITDHPTHVCWCGLESRRLFSSVGRGISRPQGWSLKPHEPGYNTLPKEAEERYVKEWYQQHHRPNGEEQ